MGIVRIPQSFSRVKEHRHNKSTTYNLGNHSDLTVLPLRDGILEYHPQAVQNSDDQWKSIIYPEMGTDKNHTFFLGIFHEISHPAIGDPSFMESLI